MRSNRTTFDELEDWMNSRSAPMRAAAAPERSASVRDDMNSVFGWSGTTADRSDSSTEGASVRGSVAPKGLISIAALAVMLGSGLLLTKIGMGESDPVDTAASADAQAVRAGAGGVQSASSTKGPTQEAESGSSTTQNAQPLTPEGQNVKAAAQSEGAAAPIPSSPWASGLIPLLSALDSRPAELQDVANKPLRELPEPGARSDVAEAQIDSNAPSVSLLRPERARHLAGRLDGKLGSRELPKEARIANSPASVIVDIHVATNGRAAACDVVASSGNSALDAFTCDQIATNFRYEPARDSQGRAVADVLRYRQNWWSAKRP